jgi:hypothetical protein
MKQISLFDLKQDLHVDYLHEKRGYYYGIRGIFISNVKERPFHPEHNVELYFISEIPIHGMFNFQAYPQNRNYARKYKLPFCKQLMNRHGTSSNTIDSLMRFRSIHEDRRLTIDSYSPIKIPFILTPLLCTN